MDKSKLNISVEAQEIVKALNRVPKPLPDLDDIKTYRQTVKAGYQPQTDKAVAEFSGQLENIEVGGVPCLQVTPEGWDAKRGACIQYAYGGGYISGSPEEDLVVTAPLAELCGARFVCVDYCLSPEHQYPLPQQDMMAVYQLLSKQYAADRLAVMGESAGGNQALGLLGRIKQQALPMPRCAVLLSPWIDLSHQGVSHRFGEGHDPSLTLAYLQRVAAAHAGDTPLDDPGLSPLFADLSGLPPVFITSATRDLLISQAVLLSRKLRQADVETRLELWDGLWHLFEFYPIPEKMESLRLVADFIRQSTDT